MPSAWQCAGIRAGAACRETGEACGEIRAETVNGPKKPTGRCGQKDSVSPDRSRSGLGIVGSVGPADP